MAAENCWKFSERGFNDVEQEVTEGDQFNTETVPETEALVREATQNSQDARRVGSEEPVQLRFARVDSRSGLNAEYMRVLLADMMPHLEASRFNIPDNLLAAPSALIIEDFGTEGLTGKTDDEQDDGNFRSFWFRHGRSFKQGSKNGRWGLGKLVYPMMSASRCLFGLTKREGEGSALLLGQAVHRTHFIDGVRYAPHGHFGDWSGQRLQPIRNPQDISDFKKAFQLARQNEPGLSVVVPFPVGDIDRDHLLRFVVKNYAYPILTGRLVIDVLDQEVNSESVRRIAKDVLPAGLIGFIDAAHNFDSKNLVKVSKRERGSEERITESMLDAEISTLRDQYSKGEVVGFQVPISLGRKKGEVADSAFTVFFQAALQGQEQAALYVRGDITVPDEAAQFSAQGCFAMLVAQDDAISEFLADAENPAHTKWAATAARVKQNWTYPRQTLGQIRYAPTTLHRFLATGQDRVHKSALKSFFWVEDPAQPPDKIRGKGQRTKQQEGPELARPPRFPAEKRKLLLQKRKGGFSVKPGPGFIDATLPAVVKVTVCYDVEHGKPKWDRLDFDFTDSELRVNSIGAEHEASDNVVLLTIEDREFELLVDGFDLRRDLIVDYNIIRTREAVDA
ncbi:MULTISPECIES: hypothetical protein [unclassified Bradyrhizobium]|uniref:hypothetical protein n=1 Tax=unclassified Bradyrhizobium TaxID=2631580 RepID=UPI0028EA2F67|nr:MULTISPECIES: hypothetical protein [unclassified Bradyrhizobium]